MAAGADLETLANLQATLDAMPTTGAIIAVPRDLYYACLADAQGLGLTIETQPLEVAISFLYHGQWITPA